MMNTFLDLLIVVAMVLLAASLVSVALMFLVKNKTVKRVCLWIVAALGIYMGYVGLRIMGTTFMGQALLALLMALVAIGAVVLERLSKNHPKLFLTAQIASAVALFVGMANALAW